MKFLNQLPSSVQGALLIIAGIIILFDALGYATQILHVTVLIGATILIIWGVITADIVGKIYRLIKRDNSAPKPPVE